jgi:hypothetical protein
MIAARSLLSIALVCAATCAVALPQGAAERAEIFAICAGIWRAEAERGDQGDAASRAAGAAQAPGRAAPGAGRAAPGVGRAAREAPQVVRKAPRAGREAPQAARGADHIAREAPPAARGAPRAARGAEHGADEAAARARAFAALLAAVAPDAEAAGLAPERLRALRTQAWLVHRALLDRAAFEPSASPRARDAARAAALRRRARCDALLLGA